MQCTSLLLSSPSGLNDLSLEAHTSSPSCMVWRLRRSSALEALCAQVLSQWMPMDEEPRGRGAWSRRRTPQAAASVLLLIDSHPLVLNHMVSPSWNLPIIPLSRQCCVRQGIMQGFIWWEGFTHCLSDHHGTFRMKWQCSPFCYCDIT